LNELGSIATMQARYSDAQAIFTRMVDIYRSVYHDHHYLIGIAQSNLATVYMSQKQYARAEPLFREAIRRFIDTLSAQHLNTAIARIKLGHTLLGERRYGDAEAESLAGYRILSKQASPSVTWLKNARKDLLEIYSATHQAEKAKEFQEIRPAGTTPG
jgi:serine/threonine-protein kinase